MAAAAASLCFVFQPLSSSPITFAEAAQTRSWYSSATNNAEKEQEDCPFYGCPLTPQDVYYNTEDFKMALEKMRSYIHSKKASAEQENAERILKTSARRDAATLTLIGYKGGSIEEQMNQDRALIVSPYNIVENEASIDDKNLLTTQHRLLLGVFDGHAPLGEGVAEHTKSELPRLLATKLKTVLGAIEEEEKENLHGDASNNRNKKTLEDKVVSATKSVITETFVELDRTAPAHVSGGCTATIVFQQGRKVYVANAGDSRSFLVAYRPSTGKAKVVYISREDKPHLPDERARVEATGGQVYIPVRGTSRVVYQDPRTNSPAGLAMSRSIGDWAAGKLGVIPNPIVEVLDIPGLVQAQLQPAGRAAEYAVKAQGKILSSDKADLAIDDVHLFAVSATDGMMDYIAAEEIARVLAASLYSDQLRKEKETSSSWTWSSKSEEEGNSEGEASPPQHVVTACEGLVFAAANAWQKAKQGRYRDDIAIAVSTIRKPPTASAQT